MSLFDWLLVAHLVGDFLFQSESMAINKMASPKWMLAHVGAYMGAIVVVLGVYAYLHRLPWWLVVLALLFIAGTHVLLDMRFLTNRWMGWVGTSTDHPWLPTVVDQVFHILTLAILAQVLVAF
jgi:hypothetical protein